MLYTVYCPKYGIFIKYCIYCIRLVYTHIWSCLHSWVWIWRGEVGRWVGGGGGMGEKGLKTKLLIWIVQLRDIFCIFFRWATKRCPTPLIMSSMYTRAFWASLWIWPEAEFLDEILTKVYTDLTWDFYFFKLTQTLTVFAQEKGGEPDRKPYPPFPMV